MTLIQQHRHGDGGDASERTRCGDTDNCHQRQERDAESLCCGLHLCALQPSVGAWLICRFAEIMPGLDPNSARMFELIIAGPQRSSTSGRQSESDSKEKLFGDTRYHS